MKQFPIFLNLEQRRCLVLGGDHASQCKVELLLASGAAVEVHADKLSAVLRERAMRNEITHHLLSETAPCAKGCSLVIIGDSSLAHRDTLSLQCSTLGIPFNVVDKPDQCSFTVPSIVDRAPITIAIGSQGQSPVLARRIRAQIDAIVPSTTGALAALLGRYRPRVADRVPARQRRGFWDAIIDGPVANLCHNGELGAAEETLKNALKRPSAHLDKQAEIYLIDCRHGATEHMSLAAIQALHRIEHLVHDAHAPEAILTVSRRDAHRHAAPVSHGSHDISACADQLEKLAAGGENVALVASGEWFDANTRAKLCQHLRARGLRCHDILTVEPTPLKQRLAS